MRVVVVGAGAIGCFYGAMLQRQGHEVHYVARGTHGAALARNGLELSWPEGHERLPVQVYESVGAAAGLAADLALVTVKWRDLAEVATALGALLAPHGVALPLLNGLESEQVLAAALGAERVVGGIAMISALLVGPGHARVLAGGALTLAPLRPDLRTAADALGKVLGEAVPCKVEERLDLVLWRKLLWNAPFNGICALTGLDAGDVIAHPEAGPLLRACMEEVCRVALAQGVPLELAESQRMIERTARDLPRTIPSQLQDLRAGKRTEVEILQGAVVRAGRASGIATPHLTTLYALLLGRELAADVGDAAAQST